MDYGPPLRQFRSCLPRDCKTSPEPPAESTDDSGVRQGPEPLAGVSAWARQARRVGRLSDLGPKPRGPESGRGTARGRGPPAQSRLLVARLLNCVRIIVVLEAVHSGRPLRYHPQASAERLFTPQVPSLKCSGTTSARTSESFMRACADIPSEGLVRQAGPEDLLLPFATGVSSYSETYEAATLLLEVAVSTLISGSMWDEHSTCRVSRCDVKNQKSMC